MTLRSDPKRVAQQKKLLAKLGPAPAWYRVVAKRRWKRSYRAIMAMDVSLFGAMLKEFYTPKYVQTLARRKLPSIGKGK